MNLAQDSSTASSEWQPGGVYAKVARQERAGIEDLQGMIFAGNVYRALHAIYAIEARFPQHLGDLLTAGLLFHVPLGPNGQALEIVQLQPGESPSALQVGIRFGQQSTEVLLPRSGGSPMWRETFAHAPIAQGYAQAVPRTPVRQLMSEYFSNGGQQYAAPNPADPPHLANKYLFRSDQMNEKRLLKFHSTVTNLVHDYMQVHGVMPTSWQAVLDTFQIAPLNYSPLDPRALVTVGGSTMMYQAEVDPGRSLLRCYLKPTLPAFDRFAYEFVLDAGSGRVSQVEDVAQARPAAYRPLLVTFVPVDPLPDSTRSIPLTN